MLPRSSITIVIAAYALVRRVSEQAPTNASAWPGQEPEPGAILKGSDPFILERDNLSTSHIHPPTQHTPTQTRGTRRPASGIDLERTPAMRNHILIRTLGSVVLAATMALGASGAAHAQDSQDYYPGMGKVFDKTSLVQEIVNQEGKNLIDPDAPQFPREPMENVRAQNKGTKHIGLFSSAPGQEQWFGRQAAHDLVVPGCDPTNLVLKRDMVDVVLDDDGCTVLTGTLIDPFYEKHPAIQFDAASGDDAFVQVVPVVPLDYAYARGGHSMAPDARLALANDPLNYVAVSSSHVQPGMGPGEEGLFSTTTLTNGVEYAPMVPVGFIPGIEGIDHEWMLRSLAVMMKYGLTMEPDSERPLQARLQNWEGTLDTSRQALDERAKTPFMDPTQSTGEPSSSPSASASSDLSTVPEGAQEGQEDSSDSEQQESSTMLPLLLALAAFAVALAAGLFPLRRKNEDTKERGSRRAG